MPRRVAQFHGLWLIAAFKLFKGLFLLALGVGILKSLHHDLAVEFLRWGDRFRVDPGNAHFQRMLEKVSFISYKKLKALDIGTFFYSALMLTEGIGLSLAKRWAEYFSIAATSLLLPLEIYELVKKVDLARVALLAINIAIVIYLIREVRRHQKAEAGG
jgi:uncharacterized membrane protein (DUF2068 family)